MRKMSPRQARRIMQRMGLSMNPMEVEEAILRMKDREITIENPEVAVLEMQGQKIFQIIGGKVTERQIEKKMAIPEEDVHLVAQQAKVSLDQARAALEQTNGDLAQAILLLSQQ
ncbi:nascent polypeptide-associated complex protein [Candidatus Bathyarchaeota archaeon]|nr:MAG: nascent polypeptide-associated complex protein [Candidatus Bathyarchaeota archaeon]